MKRILSLMVIVGGLLFGTAAPAFADVDDFTFESFDAQYELSRDSAGHSLLTTTETLVAVFPQADQNRGIRRLLVAEYDGHPTGIELVSVTDDDGNPREFEAEFDDDNLVVTIADEDVYVHGEQSYVITYTQRYVTTTVSNPDADEFYWDVNGTDWAQPFEEVTATVTLGADLMVALNGNVDAFSGSQRERGPAAVQTTGSGFTFSANNLQPGETLSFAMGFEPGTFEPRDGSFFASPLPSIALLATVAGLLVIVWAGFTRARTLRDAPGQGTIVPEYVAPKNANIFLSSVILHKQTKAITAAILTLAVAGNIRVIELAGKRPRYQLQFVTADGTDADEREFLHALFGDTLDADEVRSLKGADQKAATRIGKLMKRVTADATVNGFRRKVHAGRIGLLVVLSAVSAIFAAVFAIMSLDQAYGGGWPVLLLVLAPVSTITTIILVSKVPLTESGVQLRDYLRGLNMYIELAEADRIRYLQSPLGAESTPVAADNTREVVTLNEKLLPYAVLFGHEKEWAAELGRYYDELGTQPGWYAGQSAFNAAVFSSSIGTMAVSAASAYSSAAGGSSGGGFAGGGGGGGGGGGV